MARSKNHSNLSDYKWTTDKLIIKDVCFECGSNQEIHYHHVVPETKGGSMTLPLCIICHGKVHNRDFLKIKELQKIGIKKAKERGVYKGRKRGAIVNTEKWLSKPKISQAAEYLKLGYKARDIVKLVDIHVNTITKIKRYLKMQEVDNISSL
jgi:hypothetical protein